MLTRNSRIFLPTLAMVIAITSACAGKQGGRMDSSPVFQHEIEGSEHPWTNANFDAAEQKFTFAIFSDLTGGERERIFEIAIAQLALLRPELIVNVGDLIEGGTTDRDYLDYQWDKFDNRAQKATAKVFYTGGNHDLSNGIMREVWEARYGRRYYHFKYKNALFLVLDTEDYPLDKLDRIFKARTEALELVKTDGWAAFNETRYAKMPEQKTGEVGAAQSAYFEKVIADNAAVRWTFILMHKPAWKKEGEQNFAAIESALSDRPYTVFGGHFHHYLYEKRHGRDYIQLGTTGGVQFASRDLSIDHVALVTVSDQGVDIANLKMSGIFDKTGQIPLGGDSVCFDARECESDAP